MPITCPVINETHQIDDPQAASSILLATNNRWDSGRGVFRRVWVCTHAVVCKGEAVMFDFPSSLGESLNLENLFLFHRLPGQQIQEVCGWNLSFRKDDAICACWPFNPLRYGAYWILIPDHFSWVFSRPRTTLKTTCFRENKSFPDS